MAVTNPAPKRGPTSGIHSAAKAREKPMLASEALREDLAPSEPGKRQFRFWLIGIAFALVGLGFAFRNGIGNPELRWQAATVSFSAAGALIATAVLPFGYGLRAAVSFVIGIGLMAMGLKGSGPLSGIALDGGFLRDLTRLITLTLLPAALLFRAHYRAYRRARYMLATALVLALPFVVTEGLLLFNQSAEWVTRIAAGVNVLIVVCSLFGFTSSATSGGGSWWAMFVLFLVPVEIGLRQFTPLADAETGYLLYPATALGVQCASMLAALGLFQVVAARFGPHARDTSLPPPTKLTPVPVGPKPEAELAAPHPHPAPAADAPKALRQTH
ncbi:MAG: hypothetical protein H6718_33500 [Polyangiaceae bacterium]|nr:hypothetical protein [Myxococcales bacterium]MCB9590375.1 hypothetical protein [Polyangiaceae bacterium]MCB9604970.1 hypothetical protein [Polyangiaceae bacterium]